MSIDWRRYIECLDHENLNASEKYVYNPLAVPLGGICLKIRATPNAITAFWGLLMIVASIGFYFGDYILNILCGIAWVIAYALDCTDGPVARYTGLKSPRGDYLDGVNHRVSYPLLMFFIGYSAYAAGCKPILGFGFDPVAYLILGVAAGICMVLIIDLTNIYNRLMPEETIDGNEGSLGVEGKRFAGRKGVAALFMLNPVAFTNMIVLIPIFAALDRLDLFIIFYGIMYPLGAMVRYAIYLRKLPKPM